MIRVLDKNIADKIAAGEVVERPSSIVKELVENSIDAGARAISVEIKKGGKSLIRVSDDGSGIPSSEAETAFLRHATSKIESEADLDAINTLGFRGEALSSIAAVSRVEMLTKEKHEQSGRRIIIEGGEILKNEASGCPEGTSLIVRDLFYNVPARLKFLRSDAAEAANIIDLVSRLALGNPKIRFRLINNDNVLFQTRGDGDIISGILTIYDPSLVRSLSPVSYEDENAGLRIRGYVSKVNESRTSRRSQFFFVNGRMVESRLLSEAVSAAYSDKLFSGRFPLCYLFIELNPAEIDVNIHPSKREIRFHRGDELREALIRAIRDALLERESIPELRLSANVSGNTSGDSAAADAGDNEPVDYIEVIEKEREGREEGSKAAEQVDIINLLSNIRLEEELREDSLSKNDDEKAQRALSERLDFSSLNIAGSIFATYIAAYDSDNFYLIDQHAAHERIFYEKLMREYDEAEKPKQLLLAPILCTTDLSLKERALALIDALKAFGYDIEEFGPKTLKINAVPAFMELSEAEGFLHYFMDKAEENTNYHDPAVLDRLATRACKAAVKGNDRLDMSEIRELLRELSYCENPYSCPHGRPTFIKMSKYEIERNFKRS